MVEILASFYYGERPVTILQLGCLGDGSAAHRGEDLQVGFWLSAQGIFDPLAILVKHSSNDQAAALKLAPPDLFQLLLETQFQLSHLFVLQALLHLGSKDSLPLHYMLTHAGHRLRQRRLQRLQWRVRSRVR